MKILWLSWKDATNPKSGGAEVVMHELSKRLIADGHDVTILTVQYPGAKTIETIDGIEIIRVGKSRYLHPFVAALYYMRHLRNRYDIVIEVVNTAPYMSPFYKGKARSILFYHQLARQVWFYEAPFPISAVGYLVLEPVATLLLGLSNTMTITVSESTKKDLMRFHFNKENIHIISEGITLRPVKNLEDITKYKDPTALIFGAARTMKRTLDQVKAFEIAKQSLPDLKLIIAGDISGEYGESVIDHMAKSDYAKSIECLGRVSEKEKAKIMQQCHVLLNASVKEGWCLVVTEANSQGTPAVVYDVDGLRDSVKNKVTGVICNQNPEGLAEGIVNLLKDPTCYNGVRKEGWSWSMQITFKHSYLDFKQVVDV